MTYAEKMGFDEEELAALDDLTQEHFWLDHYVDLPYDDQVAMYDLALAMCIMP